MACMHRIASHIIAVQCSAVHGMHGMALHHIASHCDSLHCIALHCIASHCIALHCIASHCIVSHCIALHRIALQGVRPILAVCRHLNPSRNLSHPHLKVTGYSMCRFPCANSRSSKAAPQPPWMRQRSVCPSAPQHACMKPYACVTSMASSQHVVAVTYTALQLTLDNAWAVHQMGHIVMQVTEHS